MDAKQKTRETAAKKSRGFQRFLEEPTTKLLMTLIPPSDNPDALRTLLEACYSAGFNEGSSDMAISFLEMVFKDKPKRDQRGAA